MKPKRNTSSYLFLATVLLLSISSIAKGELLQDVLEDLENNPSENQAQGKQQDAPNPPTSQIDPVKATTTSMQTIEYKTTTLSEPPLPNEAVGNQLHSNQAMASLVFIAVIVAICVVGCVAFLGGAYFWYKHTSMTSSAARHVFYRSSDSSVLIHNDYQPMGERDGHVTSTNNNMARLAEKTDYPAYGVTGPNPLRNSYKGPSIDVNLNRSAEVYHYQQQKQKLKALSSASSERSSSNRSRPSTSDTLNNDVTSGGEIQENDEENSDGEYTVYECPGPASKTDEPLEIHNPLFADSESTFSSYDTLGGGIATSKYNYPTTVGNHG